MAGFSTCCDGMARHSKEVEFANSIPFVAEVRDVNGDGMGEVVLNESDAYVSATLAMYGCSTSA